MLKILSRRNAEDFNIVRTSDYHNCLMLWRFRHIFVLALTLMVTGVSAYGQGSVYRSKIYRGVSQSSFIHAAELSKECYEKCRKLKTSDDRALLKETVDSITIKCDMALELIDKAMEQSDNPEDCEERATLARINLKDMKEFAPMVLEEGNESDFLLKKMTMSVGAGQTSINLFHLSMITHDDKSPNDDPLDDPQNDLDKLAEDASRSELDEAALNLLKEAYQRDMDAMADGGEEGDYLGEDDASKADAANDKLSDLQEGMESDIVKLMDALSPIDPLADEEEGLTSEGEIIFDPEVGNELMYRIQIGYYRKNRNPEHFYGLHPVYAFTTKEGYAKFYTGQFKSYRKAVEVKNYIRANFVPDAFVVPYKGGGRISISDAIFSELEVLGNK
jgi:hypothetical protein